MNEDFLRGFTEGMRDGMGKEAGLIGDGLRLVRNEVGAFVRSIPATPGIALRTAAHPVQAVRDGLAEIGKQDWYMRPLAAGGIGFSAYNNAKAEDMYGRRRGVAERVMGTTLGAVGDLASYPMGLFPGTVIGSAAGGLGRMVGRKADQIMGTAPKPMVSAAPAHTQLPTIGSPK
ncbi:hypothetical protein EBT31_02870 [bacterium]|nr:hypothetical protein [bacterium]